jgi:thymidylate kinase
MRAIIFEGARGTAKSTISRKIRDKTKDSTLINFTGFSLDGIDGFQKVTDYYMNWFHFLESMKGHNSTIICDRFFFSEFVYSELYKDYDFSQQYSFFLTRLSKIADDIEILFFTIEDEEELKGRLARDKVPFGKAEESTVETMRQQDVYNEVMDEVDFLYSDDERINLNRINTTGKTLEEIEKEVFKIVGGE